MGGILQVVLFHIKDDMSMPDLLVWPDNNMEYFEVTDFYKDVVLQTRVT